MATMTASPTPVSASKTTKFQLIALMKSCIKHLEESDEYAPIIYQTSNKLHEYADAQSKQLQAQILKLQQNREQAMKQNKIMQQQHQRHTQQKNSAAASKAQATAAENKVASQKLSALEQQKRAAAERRRQQVIEQRRKAALEQKKKEEERKRQFLEMERRKEQLKAEALQKAAENKAASHSKQEQRIEDDAMSELDKIGGKTSTESDEPEVPIAHANLERITTPTGTTPNETGQGSASPATPLETTSAHSSQLESPIPSPHPPVSAPGQQQPQQKSHPNQLRNRPPFDTPPQPHHATQPSWDDAFSSTSSMPDSVATAETMEDPPGLEISEVKKQILIQWGLQPPGYQMLKRVDQLVVSIQTVFPPFAGVPAHSYFDGWKVLAPNDFLCYGADSLLPTLDTDKLKKAVRKIRFFLHPDKLPRDMTEGQMYVCKLLWDVTSDALEEFKHSKAQT